MACREEWCKLLARTSGLMRVQSGNPLALCQRLGFRFEAADLASVLPAVRSRLFVGGNAAGWVVTW